MLEIDRSIRYYISGPMAGYPEMNFPMFAEAVKFCNYHKIPNLSPHLIQHKSGDQPWEEFLRKDIEEMLKHCSGIILLPGWPQSKGARMELSTALTLNWPVHFLDPHAKELLNMNKRLVA